MSDRIHAVRNRPRTPAEIRRDAPPALSLQVRRKLKMSRDAFCIKYRIPYGNLREWDRHDRKPQTIGVLLLKMIEADPEGTAAIIAKTDVELKATWRQKQPIDYKSWRKKIKMEERVA